MLWISGTEQPDLFKRVEEIFDGQTRFITKLPENLYTEIEKMNKKMTIIIDDLMHEISNLKDLGNYSPRGDRI